MGAPKLKSGENISQAVYDVLFEWEISTNTGPNMGACVLLEELLGRKIINLGCRHHMYELVLKNIFEKKYGATSGPETPIFNRFADKWHEIKQDQFNSALNDSIVCSKISDDEFNQIKEFCGNELKHEQICGDYKDSFLLRNFWSSPLHSLVVTEVLFAHVVQHLTHDSC